MAGVDLEDNGGTEMMGKLDEAMRSLVDSSKYIEIHRDMLDEYIRSNSIPSDDASKEYTDKASRALQAYNESTNTSKYASNEAYRSFREEVWEVNHPDDPLPSLFPDDPDNEGEEGDGEELVVAAAKISLKCPLTASWLEEPVTNNVCGHNYSKEAVLNHIRSNLAPNKALERRVERHIRKLEEENLRSQSQYTLIM
ncbi:hypothetical protein EV182_000638 [Spiromyces aspiralis]|uniref:Uncharacterized protein n=1 Tax=Spiromyces aspiralis TaxID=68401 RepID=A0ACC1HK96_9FUNG|nr:hypothetical protein EV182_000638 [Spiromyces aspiralis]